MTPEQAQRQAKTIVLDFDGVIHSYTSGWQGADKAADPPVPGAREFLITALEHYQVAVLSSRTHQEGGKECMAAYIVREMNLPPAIIEWGDIGDGEKPEAALRGVQFINRIRFPDHKPPAHLTIDDRAMTFEGRWPSMEQIASFQPWTKPQQATSIYAWRTVMDGLESVMDGFRNEPSAVPEVVLMVEQVRDEEGTRRYQVRLLGTKDEGTAHRLINRAADYLPT